MIWLATNVLYLSREDWGANQSYPRLGYPLIPRSNRYYNITHHTVGVDSDTTKNVWENLDEIRFMMKRLQLIRPDLGADVPYNFVAFPAILDGKHVLVICEGRGYDLAGAHTAGYDGSVYFNVGGVATSWAGNFEDFAFDYSLWESPNKAWLKHLKTEMVNLGSRTVCGQVTCGHRDFKEYAKPLNQTACCGQNLYKHLGDFTFEGPTPEEEDMATLAALMGVGGLFLNLLSDVEQGFPKNESWCNQILVLIGPGPTSPVGAKQHAKGLLEYSAGEALKGIAINPQATKELRYLVTTWPTLV